VIILCQNTKIFHLKREHFCLHDSQPELFIKYADPLYKSIFMIILCRHLLTFRRADLTTCCPEKLSPRAERGDLIVLRDQHEIATVTSLLAAESTPTSTRE